MYIAKPQPNTHPCGCLMFSFADVKPKSCTRRNWRHAVQLSEASSPRHKQTAKHSWEPVVIPFTLHNPGILCYFQVLVAFPVILYEFSPQDSEAELLKMM